MDKCENCEHGVYSPIRDEQIGHQGMFIENWICNHPDDEIRKKSKLKGWAESCPEYIAKE